jgi:hypothetical protein
MDLRNDPAAMIPSARKIEKVSHFLIVSIPIDF